MALTITNTPEAVSKQGSGKIWGALVQGTGEDLSTPDTYHLFGPSQKTNYDRKVTQTKDKDAGGVSFVASNDTESTMSYVIMQRDGDHLNLPVEHEDDYFRFIQELSAKLIAGKQQFLIVACAQVVPGISIDTSDMYVKHSYNCSPYTGASALTVTLTGLVGSNGTVGTQTATITNGEYEKIIEF